MRWIDSLSDNWNLKTCPKLSCSIQNYRSFLPPIENPWLGLTLIAFVLVAAGAVVHAQQVKKVPRIGYLSAATPLAVLDRTEAIRQGLRELGYVEGKNIVFEWRYAEGKFDRLPALAAELVRLKADVIVTAGAQTTRFAKEATSTIPIVMTNDSDPVGSGFIVSLARPGGNITGLSSLAQDLSAKRLELLKETVPKLTRAAILGSSAIPGNARSLKETEHAGSAFGVEIQYLEIKDPKDIERAFRAARKGRADAVLVLNGPPHVQQLIPDYAVKNRLPAIYFNSATVSDGGLMSYGANIADLDRRATVYIDKILKGAKPADLPVEQPKKFEFMINLKAAKQIGLTIPPNVLARADRVIK
jgi:putative ABC transport system substrate-binding protein